MLPRSIQMLTNPFGYRTLCICFSEICVNCATMRYYFGFQGSRGLNI